MKTFGVLLIGMAVALTARPAPAAEPASAIIRGKLTQDPDKSPCLVTREGKRIALEGDEPTRGVLKDKRLAGVDLELKGHFTAPDSFAVDHIHTKSMYVYKDGKKLAITYWCDVCSIRTYSPGICWCCQQETALDLRDPDKAFDKP